MIFNLYKPAGWTPLQAIRALQKMRPELKGVNPVRNNPAMRDAVSSTERTSNGVKIACAGRLDPMAEGVLVVMADEALKELKSKMSAQLPAQAGGGRRASKEDAKPNPVEDSLAALKAKLGKDR